MEDNIFPQFPYRLPSPVIANHFDYFMHYTIELELMILFFSLSVNVKTRTREKATKKKAQRHIHKQYQFLAMHSLFSGFHFIKKKAMTGR